MSCENPSMQTYWFFLHIFKKIFISLLPLAPFYSLSILFIIFLATNYTSKNNMAKGHGTELHYNGLKMAESLYTPDYHTRTGVLSTSFQILFSFEHIISFLWEGFSLDSGAWLWRIPHFATRTLLRSGNEEIWMQSVWCSSSQMFSVGMKSALYVERLISFTPIFLMSSRISLGTQEQVWAS